MKYIDYNRFSELRLVTYTKEATDEVVGVEVKDFTTLVKKGQALLLKSADEIPFVFYSPKNHLVGCATLSKEQTLNEYLKEKMHIIITQYNLDPQDIYCYLGPSLTFSHTIVERKVIEALIQKGYRAAAKRTSGVDFFDTQMMNVVILRNLSIPFVNITIDNHDTFENPSLLYSEMRGDTQKNVTVVELLK